MRALRRGAIPLGLERRRGGAGSRALLTALALLVAGCTASGPAGPAASPTLEPFFTPRAGAPGATQRPAAPRNLSDGDVAALLRAAVCWYDQPADAAKCTPPGPAVVSTIEAMGLSGDRRFVAPLVDMLALDIGWERYVRESLARIAGTRQPDVRAWQAWVAAEQPPLPPNYATWKGHLLSLVDRRYVDLVSDRLGNRIRPEELLWGGVGVNGLPPLDHPATVHRVEQRYLADGDVVFGVLLDQEPRAYPERILGWHELVSDRLDGHDILISYCTPCGSAAAYSATASDGRAYALGTSGLVYRSRRLLFDNQTHSLWDPISGAAIAGPLAASGVHLVALPLLRTTWGDWVARHPDARVLSLDTGYVRDYAEGAAQRAERVAPGPLFPSGNVDKRAGAKDPVFGLVVDGEARAYPLGAVESARIVHDRLGGRDVILISLGPGTGVSAYDESDVRFASVEGTPDALVAIDGEALRWFIDERRLLNSRNARTRDAIPGATAYWFAWSDALPSTSVWKP